MHVEPGKACIGPSHFSLVYLQVWYGGIGAPDLLRPQCAALHSKLTLVRGGGMGGWAESELHLACLSTCARSFSLCLCLCLAGPARVFFLATCSFSTHAPECPILGSPHRRVMVWRWRYQWMHKAWCVGRSSQPVPPCV